MDFALPYTEEQETFRKEVRSWVEENVPEDMKDPVDYKDITEEHYQFWREKQIELAQKGWLYPTYPKEYGGGGLTGDHETIIEEEFLRGRVVKAPNQGIILSTLLVWATEEQKQKFLVPMLKGEMSSWQKFTEPKGGADLANYQSKAVRDGDDWLLTGSNVFIGDRADPDMIWGPMMTDPDAPRHRNLGFFMIPVPTPGLTIKVMDMLVNSEKRAIFLDDVRVPGDHLIGGDHQGWQVAGTTLEQEHGGRGKAFPLDEVVENLVHYARDKKHNGGTLSDDPVIQQTTMEAVIDAHRNTLLAKRTYWMYQNRMDINYEGNVANVHGRDSSLRNARAVREVMGMYSYLNTREPGVPHGGTQETNQRDKAGQNHAGGSTNIARVVLARRIGISRTQEKAAPTPSTATSHSS
jgi:alkylation response protein AidB-like acyl-CoA dehydrogenase